VKPGFTGSPLHRLNLEHDADTQFAAHLADPRARLLRLSGLDPVADAEGALAWAALTDAPAGAELALLGIIDDAPRFVALDPAARGSMHAGIFALLTAMPAGEAALYATARSLVDWHARHGFCARCGVATAASRAGWARQCPACSTIHFPRTDPVVIMLAEEGDAILLGRQASWPAGRFSALAGFVEVGESIEEAVARELFEEAGVRVTDVRYVVSQPWPFPSQLMIACMAKVETRDLALDLAEIVEGIWVTREEVRAALAGDPGSRFAVPPPYAIAHTLLARWAAD